MIYYNENEPYCVEWLRNLIREGLLPEGDVDDRSIEEVEPADLRGYSQCHFFAGIGGWAYALQLAMFPDDRYVWTGSCPCQPFSSAGKQNGAADERHLWPVWFRLIRECRPSVVFGEQVAQAISWGWLDAVYADLEGEGYACAAAVLPACSVGAPHIRQRLWFVADPRGGRQGIGADIGQERQPDKQKQHEDLWREFVGQGTTGVMADAAVHGHTATENGRGVRAKQEERRVQQSSGVGDAGVMADAGFATRERYTGGISGKETEVSRAWQQHGDMPDRPESGGATGVVADSTSERRHPTRRTGQASDESGAQQRPDGLRDAGGVGDSECIGREMALQQQRGGGTTGVERQANEPGGTGSPWADLEWLPCADGKARPTQPGIFPLAHGIPARVGKLRAAGNAICPQAAQAFIEAYMEC